MGIYYHSLTLMKAATSDIQRHQEDKESPFLIGRQHLEPP